MKQSFFKFSGKKFITAAFLTASVLLTSFSANATVNKGNIEILSGENTNIQFAGSTSDALLFKVHINNTKGDNFTLTIKDNSGNVLFSKSFNNVDFQKQFKVLRADQDNSRYFFTITSENKNLEDTYAVIAESHTVENVEINKM